MMTSGTEKNEEVPQSSPLSTSEGSFKSEPRASPDRLQLDSPSSSQEEIQYSYESLSHPTPVDSDEEAASKHAEKKDRACVDFHKVFGAIKSWAAQTFCGETWEEVKREATRFLDQGVKSLSGASSEESAKQLIAWMQKPRKQCLGTEAKEKLGVVFSRWREIAENSCCAGTRK